MHRQGQLALSDRRTWGGRRAGAGRKRLSERRRVRHARRPTHEARCPAHVTLRVHPDVPSLRVPLVFSVVRAALAAASKAHFRLLHFSVQRDHLHLLVEAEDAKSLTRGLQGLAIRVARAINKVVGRRGRVWWDRFHARLLRTPREVRSALVYVLQNVRKHVAGASGIDACSSARWFSGWRWAVVARDAAPVVAPRTWLARVGWRRHGLIEVWERPRRR